MQLAKGPQGKNTKETSSSTSSNMPKIEWTDLNANTPFKTSHEHSHAQYGGSSYRNNKTSGINATSRAEPSDVTSKYKQSDNPTSSNTQTTWILCRVHTPIVHGGGFITSKARGTQISRL